jgi:ring-1,2-phenylacetyl-CoA epoxidase subunit PaaD
MSDVGRDKLRAYGISPPERDGNDVLDITKALEPRVACPRCTSSDVALTSRFGSTPCKALYRCLLGTFRPFQMSLRRAGSVSTIR